MAVVVALLTALSARAQTGGAARTLAGRCGAANWVCVAQCIDVTCVDKCLATGCEKALDALVHCSERTRCGADDSVCVARACDDQCGRSFEPAGKSSEREAVDPCRRVSPGAAQRVPEELVGNWTLEAASIRPEEREHLAAEEGKDVKPRPDYGRSLRVTSSGCFVMETKLEDATLGKGNALEVRSWGTLQVDPDKETVRLRARDGQAVGPVCGKARAISLSKGQFPSPSYEYEIEEDLLTLTAETSSKQTFQFRRLAPLKKP